MQEAAKDAGLKPILGVEAYISETDRFDRRSVKKRDDNTSVFNHIILLAKDQGGVNNLNKLSEIAWTEGFYNKPRIDLEVLDEYGSGLIVLSGCMNGLIAKAIEREQDDKADRITSWFKDRFGDDFYMEIQPHNPVELNNKLLDLADLYSVKPVVTNDCHFATEDQRALEEALLILSTKPKIAEGATYAESKKIKNVFERLNYLYPDRPISFEKIDVYVQSRELAAKSLSDSGIDRTDVFENTLEIADKVSEYEYYENLSLLPVPKTNASDRLTSMCNSAMKKRGFDKNDRYVERLQIELDIIKSKDFSAYFLIEADMVKWAVSKDILVGPGRGSAAGSLVCYLLGITQVDPIENGLLFARFINEERNDFPDIDTDFQDTRRNEVKEYLHRKFKNVASIATYAYFKDKGVIRDAARVFHVPLGEVNKALKTMGQTGTFDDFVASPNTADFRKAHPEVVEYARALRGRIRGTGAHAAGLVVSDKPISNYAPLETRNDKTNLVSGRVVVTAYDMEQVANIGLIKFDLLGLKTLSVIKDTVDAIKEHKGKDINLLDINLNDEAVLAMLTAGYTKGVFQVEATPYTKLVMDMGVSKFDHLVASNALVRPGAMNTVGASFVARKDGREQVKYAHPILEEITKETYGVIIYQEQVMQTIVKLAGMSWAEADKVRKIIGKKKDVREFEQYREKFVAGASKHVSTEVAERLWHDFEAHAGYSFNKSHAFAYSMLSLWTAWLKYHYPLEFMYGILRNESDGDSLTDYLIEAKRLGITIYLPHINKSKERFSIEGKGVRFGLGNIKSISHDKSAPRILAKAPYKSYYEFLEYAGQKGSGINSRVVDSLNAIGAAKFSDNPLKGDESSHYYEYLNIPKFSAAGLSAKVRANVVPLEDYEEQGCFIHLAMVKKIAKGKGWSRVELVDETGTVGLFHDEHTTIDPGQMYLILAAENRISRFIPIDDLENRSGDALIKFLETEEIKIPDDKRIVLAFNSLKTKSAGKSYGHVILADNKKNVVRALVFTKQYPKGLSKFKNGAVVKVALATMPDDTLYVKEIFND
jgi:DNA polymerase-3 subunit alpha